jgi:DNA (cytosine-5)-methyltransferase 1
MPKFSDKTSFESFSVVDLFCGVGGLAHGFRLEDFTVDAGIDFDGSCKYAFEQNNKATFLHKDVNKITGQELNGLFSKRKILVGCAPCQPFSIYNHKTSKDLEKQKKDGKWQLLYSFADLVKKTQPEIISMENVPLLKKFNNGKVFDDFVAILKSDGYFVTSYIVNAQDYGVPQRRRRLILFGSKYGEVKLIDKTVLDKKFKTVRDAIGELPTIEDGNSCSEDPLHKARKLTELNKKRIIATKEGGFWRDWDESLWLECHKKPEGKSFRSVYGRMSWDAVAPTVTTYCLGLGNGRFGHPEQNRAMSLREAALFQSFPKDYQFIEPGKEFSMIKIARHIGNAVPVLLGKAVAKSIKEHINEIAQ